MVTLEDKILGEKREYYCSSSSEDESEHVNSSSDYNKTSLSKWKGVSSNTGPKGVIRDWEKFRELQNQKACDSEIKMQELIQKTSMTCCSVLEDEKDNDLETDPEILNLLSDEYLYEYQKQRMQEMVKNIEQLRFSDVINLKNTDEFLDAIDNENKFVTIVIHIYEKNVDSCEAMNGSLITLAKEYPFVKFCKILGSCLNVSKHFKKEGIPALLAYKNGQLIGNFVHVSDTLGDDFFADDVSTFLMEHGILINKEM